MENNKIQQIPSNFSDLTNLRHLNLNKNKLKKIPNAFIGLKKLKYLLLQYNELSWLNIYALNNMKQIHKINLMNNPILTSMDVIKVSFFII